MRLVILESPYAGDVLNNLIYARQAVKDSLRKGESPIASHLLYTQVGILNDRKPEERSLGMNAGHAWIEKADAVVIYTDRGISKGMEKGIAIAQKLNKPIEYRKILK